MNIARAFFVNRLDKENAHWDATVAALRERYGEKVVPVQIPIGREAQFRGVVDVIRMKAYHHEGDREEILEIPADLADQIMASPLFAARRDEVEIRRTTAGEAKNALDRLEH